ncbi:MAG: pseudouridine-5'-phosphate glycosidase [Candidatus Sumerlaeaceae bacterium]|nr:pseudouridine-5'-phosphate glycosidase [Candidatus Sumerlaeaceae bacterium]
MEHPLRIAAPLVAPLKSGGPVVAFETTILSFGLPRPANREVADACEGAAREAGAIPATVALLDGQVCAGLSDEEIDFFCTSDPSIMKINLQNFSLALARRKPGALTVATTMKACAMAGIRVFATGGIGGVHRGFAETLDISSDLKALAEFPVAVICAGAKSVLDVPATLEVLETLGVPVVGYRTKCFPRFFCPDSPHQLDASFDDMAELAAFARVHFETCRGGILVVTPVPQADAIAGPEMDVWIDKALAEAHQQGVSGKAVTPFLLSRLKDLSGGRTLAANRALITNNATVASQLAVALSSKP